ncbi:hypothetical protein COUCH_19145 [Couchioplanes caeruleus]|uniref:hypothetical protein n=1 Tax=Couchioplanes caeruleus TaxID=56438 RepID=UPI0020BE6AC2|nr:hypothetical protein [Couchioplanes caeruleus]UQU68270.1 hypothetical protein COUCH_19145 [Couchioplanes caeruleus]
MEQVVSWAVFVVVLGCVMTGLAWLARRVRRRGVGHQMSGPVDMIFRPHTYDLAVEIQVQQERATPRVPVDDKADPGTSHGPADGPAQDDVQR